MFLCLVNIFNSITNKIPKADGLTAIEAFIIICIIFVFGALMGKFKMAMLALLQFLNFRICNHLIPPQGKDGQTDNIPVQEQAELSQGS